MRERISQLAGGQIYARTPALELLQPQIEEIVASGQNFRGDIRISSGNGVPFRGLIYSTDSRVFLLQNSFAGTGANISYEVRAELLEPGMEIAGAFCLVYNGGESRIPFLFQVRRSDSGRHAEAATLEEFAQMAQERPAEARDLFDSREFSFLPFMEDMSVRALYDGFRRAVNRQNSMEEFLVAAGAKPRVHISPAGCFEESCSREDDSRAEDGSSESEDDGVLRRLIVIEDSDISDEIVIRRSSWGQLEIRAASDHPAVVFEREVFTEADFTEDLLRIPVRIVHDSLYGGYNFVRLTVSTPLETIRAELVIRRSRQVTALRKKNRERRASEREFYRSLLSVLAGRDDSGQELEYLQLCWEELTRDEDPTPRQKLYRAAIGLWRQDADLAKMILEDVQSEIQAGRREDSDAYCGYLYLDFLANGGWEQKEQLIKILRHYAEEGRESVFRFLLMLRLDEGAVDRPREILHQIQVFCENGCSSPFLFMEAVRIYNRHPDIIRMVGRFECRMLHFGARYGLLEPQTIDYISSLAVQMKNYRPDLLRTLQVTWKDHPGDKVLGGICAQLIKGDQRQSSNFRWFSDGVGRDLRLTRLYDYYMYTAPSGQQEAFPREIVLYFSYNSPHDPESQKKLYSNLLKFYSQDSQIMESYQSQMREFVMNGIMSQSIDREMAYLYEQILELSDVNEQTARILPDFLHSKEITCENPACREAVVVYGELEEELSVPLRNGKACLPVYSDSCRFILVGQGGVRYAADGCEIQPLFTHTQALATRCREVNPRHAMLRLSECSRILTAEHKSESMLRTLRRELDVKEIHRQYRRSLIEAVVEEAIRREEPVEEEILTCVHYTGVSLAQRTELTRILIDMGRYAEAQRQILGIGFRQLPVESVRCLTDMSIQNGLYEKDELLLDMSRYLFDMGEWDELILEYLCTHLGALSRDLIPVLKAAREYRVNTGDMAERLLGQMLFTGNMDGIDDVFRIYMEQERTDRMLVHAYFVIKCSGYFLKGETVGEDVFSFVERQLSEEGIREVPEICGLAWMKYLSGREEFTGPEKKVGGELLAQWIRRGVAFGWMKKFDGKLHLPEEIRCREWVEYCGKSGEHLELRYKILPEMKEQAELRLPLSEVYHGIYNKSLLLYEGEELQYEIVRGEAVLEQGTRRGTASPESDGSRYAVLNRLQRTLQESRRVQEWQQDVIDFARNDTWIETIFQI